MSAKRQAETHLGPDNWDQEEPAEAEEDGGFKMAPKEVLEKRVIRTAKRRSQATADVAQKPIFSGFSGFNKTQKPSFDFLANLTNGNKSNKESSALKSDTAAVSSSSMTTNPTSSPSRGIFSLSGTSTPITKSAFGPAFTQSVFSSSKPDSTVNDSPFKGQSSISSTPFTNFTPKLNANTEKPISQVSSTLFGVPSANNSNNSPFSTKTNTPTAFKTTVTNSPQSTKEDNKQMNKSVVKNDKELVYYNNLKGLNESVSAWIKKHVEETPLCILTPIFRDYEKHLKNIQDDYEKGKEQPPSKNISDSKDNNKEGKSPASGNTSGSTLFSNNPAQTTSEFSSSQNNMKSASVEKTSNFNFGIKTVTTTSATFAATAPSTGFSFGIKPSMANTSPFTINTTTNANGSTLFSTNTTTSSNNGSTLFGNNTTISAGSGSTQNTSFSTSTTLSANNGTPFSFGIGKPFSFNSNINKSEEPANKGDDNEDEPPKVEYTPIAEENSVYEKKCKVFVKKDGNFIDKGVATLYIKKIEETGKHQLLVRANTALGNVLINMILSSSLPTQRMGKNNVMMICMPTPDAKPPPTSILIRVKTSEDADDLLETLNKFKA